MTNYSCYTTPELFLQFGHYLKDLIEDSFDSSLLIIFYFCSQDFAVRTYCFFDTVPYAAGTQFEISYHKNTYKLMSRLKEVPSSEWNSLVLVNAVPLQFAFWRFLIKLRDIKSIMKQKSTRKLLNSQDVHTLEKIDENTSLSPSLDHSKKYYYKIYCAYMLIQKFDILIKRVCTFCV